MCPVYGDKCLRDQQYTYGVRMVYGVLAAHCRRLSLLSVIIDVIVTVGIVIVIVIVIDCHHCCCRLSLCSLSTTAIIIVCRCYCSSSSRVPLESITLIVIQCGHGQH